MPAFVQMLHICITTLASLLLPYNQLQVLTCISTSPSQHCALRTVLELRMMLPNSLEVGVCCEPLPWQPSAYLMDKTVLCFAKLQVHHDNRHNW